MNKIICSFRFKPMWSNSTLNLRLLSKIQFICLGHSLATKLQDRPCREYTITLLSSCIQQKIQTTILLIKAKMCIDLIKLFGKLIYSLPVWQTLVPVYHVQK